MSYYSVSFVCNHNDFFFEKQKYFLKKRPTRINREGYIYIIWDILYIGINPIKSLSSDAQSQLPESRQEGCFFKEIVKRIKAKDWSQRHMQYAELKLQLEQMALDPTGFMDVF